jgi:hypothetical protein
MECPRTQQGEIRRRDGQHLQAGRGQLAGEPRQALLVDAVLVQAGQEDGCTMDAPGGVEELGGHGTVASWQTEEGLGRDLAGEPPRQPPRQPGGLGRPDDERHGRQARQREPRSERAAGEQR